MNISSKMDSHFTGIWVNFFTAAGIPSEVAATYALTFTENRIQNDMLLDLNKEYLRDMGITRMGDVIAILRHAKQVHENAARDRVLSSASPVQRVPVAAVAGRLTVAQSKPSSPATRMLEHYTRNATPPASPPHQATPTKRKSADNVGNDSVLGIKKTRSIRFSNPLPASSSEANATAAAGKQTVFARLGNTDVAKPAASTQTTKPIFSRLGAKADEKAAKPVSIPVPKDALKYEGILKTSPVPVKKTISITASKNNVRKIAVGTMRADQAPISIKQKLAIAKTNAVTKAAPTNLATAAGSPTKAKSVKFSNKVEYKEIESVKRKAVSVFNKPGRRLAMPASAASSSDSNSVKARLGDKSNKSNNLTITKNVFNRLGA